MLHAPVFTRLDSDTVAIISSMDDDIDTMINWLMEYTILPSFDRIVVSDGLHNSSHRHSDNILSQRIRERFLALPYKDVMLSTKIRGGLDTICDVRLVVVLVETASKMQMGSGLSRYRRKMVANYEQRNVPILRASYMSGNYRSITLNAWKLATDHGLPPDA